MNLQELSALAQASVAADAAVIEAELALKARKEAARLLKEEDLPAAMAELELTKIVLESGEEITIAQEVYAAIPVPERERAFSWLEAHEFGGLIKSELSIAFGKDELSKAETLVERLVEEGFAPELTRNVHSSTLKAFVKERLENAESEFPMELFGARAVKVAKIKPPKKAKDAKTSA